MRIKVCADSTCDLPMKLVQQENITIVPLRVNMGDGSYLDGVEINSQQIFDHVARGGDLCSTSAVNVEAYTRVFREFSGEYDAVIHVTIGSGFSSCYQNACIAAQEFSNVYVVDSNNLTTGQGIIVLAACRMARQGISVQDMLPVLKEMTTKLEVSFILDRLDYMVKGGRCSMVTALGANLLHLRPCIEVVDGQMKVTRKYRGSLEKCVSAMARDKLFGREEEIDPQMAFITHSTVPEETLSVAFELVSQYVPFHHVYDSDTGSTVSCHCGPGTLGIIFIRK